MPAEFKSQKCCAKNGISQQHKVQQKCVNWGVVVVYCPNIIPKCSFSPKLCKIWSTIMPFDHFTPELHTRPTYLRGPATFSRFAAPSGLCPESITHFWLGRRPDTQIGLGCTALHCTALHYTALHCTTIHCTALHCTALHSTAQHCTALYCSAVTAAALHCTVHRSNMPTAESH
jgi:hypothetical protein